ncbi:MAG TPA: enoyl-CoA hydratase/isomerase family protein [Nocardioidaceae bacterium]|nr:enoyl-CoA hydratase/isomerase family protein [Nocardioidaceae bacterium]
MSSTALDAELRVERSGQVVTITFNRPHARNAMTWNMYDGLERACEDIDADDGIRVAVLRGAGGKAFVAGTDITQFTEFETAEDGLAYEQRIGRVVQRLETVRVPTIARVDGYAVGGGLSLAAACDLRICTPEAKFGLPIARTLGNCVSIATCARLVALIGSARALQLVYTAELISAEQAGATGLVTELVPADQIEARVEALAAQIAGHAPLTMSATKQMVHRLADHDLPDAEDLIAACYGSADFHEGVRAFVDKQKPTWTGR